MDGVRRAGAESARRVAVPLGSALAALVLLLAACGDDDGAGLASTAEGGSPSLDVVVEPSEAAPGAKVEARVTNATEESFTYGLDYVLERREGGSFVKVDAPGAVALIGLVAEPGGTGPPVPVPIPRDAKPGEYRIVIQRDVPDVGVLSGDLTVTADR